MKVFPQSLIDREDINLRQGIKSSLPGMKKLFAITFSLFKISTNQSEFVYSEEYQKEGKTKIQLKEDFQSTLLTFYDAQIHESGLSEDDFIQKFDQTPLFEKQIEALQVALNLFWKIAKIDFYPPKSSASERTGGHRFNKKIAFSTYIDLVDLCLSDQHGEIENTSKNLLFNYIADQALSTGTIENKLIKILTIFSEETQFKIRNGTEEIFFQQEGIYAELINGQSVKSKGSKEIVGPFRILHSSIRENFHYFLKNTADHTFEFKRDFSNTELATYKNRVATYLDLIPKRIVVEQEIDVERLEISNNLNIKAQNTIYYGSPGTGKSHKADEATKAYKVKKVTFYPDYDYHSFVGGYKPSMKDEKIIYEFVPQIFTKAYIEAWQHLDEMIFLQIEEINRGNCAEIFGSLFQLLDRQADGSSRYGIEAEEELRKFLEKEENLGIGHEGIKNGKIRLPNNLSIIATMNTSDQSLFPMDSAFKRRWDWEYIPIDYNCANSNFIIELQNSKQYKWLDFLKKVNQNIYEVTESQDKQIGNWFINAKNTQGIITEKTFINKVIFYLWNDVFKEEGETIFKTADNDKMPYEKFFESAEVSNLVSYLLEERLGVEAIIHEEVTEE